MNRRILIFGLLILIIGGGGWAALAYFQSFQKVTLVLKNTKSINCYATELEDSLEYDESKGADFSASTSGTYKLKKASYVCISKGEADFEPDLRQVGVYDKPVIINVSLVYNEAKLARILLTDQPLISATLREKYPDAIRQYTLTNEKLFGTGEWYGVRLASRAGTDDLRIVMKKTSAGWVVATDPPDLVLSKPVYPDVPIEILRATNEL